jgi:hypothetical protein
VFHLSTRDQIPTHGRYITTPFGLAKHGDKAYVIGSITNTGKVEIHK